MYEYPANRVGKTTAGGGGTSWWLRSSGSGAGCVSATGGLSTDYTTYSGLRLRPAFYLNPESVIFTSAAAGGKSETAGGEFKPIFSAGTNTWKLTLLDDSLSVTVGEATGNDGSYEVSWSNASRTGNDVWLSAILVDGSGEVIQGYQKLAQVTSGSGTATFQLPAGKTPENCKVKVFLEVCSNTSRSDYASQPAELKFTGVSEWQSNDTDHWHTDADKTAHSWSEWVDNRASCTEAGTRSRYCTVCGYAQEENVTASSHQWKEHDAVWADCEKNQPGVKAYWECTACGGLYASQDSANPVSLDSLLINPKHEYETVFRAAEEYPGFHRKWRVCKNCGTSSMIDNKTAVQPHTGVDCGAKGTCTTQ